MEQFRNIIRRYEDAISAVLQLVICFSAVLLALKNNHSAEAKQKEKLLKSISRNREKLMKAKYRAKLRSVKKAQAKKKRAI